MSTMFQMTLPNATLKKGWKRTARMMKRIILSLLPSSWDLYAKYAKAAVAAKRTNTKKPYGKSAKHNSSSAAIIPYNSLLFIAPPFQVVFVFVAAAALFGDVGEVVEFVAEEAEGV